MSFPDNFIVAALSLDVVRGDKKANFTKLENYLTQLPNGTDLLVLPELFSTGYIQDAEEAKCLSETDYGDSIQCLKRIASDCNLAISGSYLSNTGDLLYNRAFFIEPNGEATFYDKRHLFCISEESKVCQKGKQLPPVVRYRRWNIALAVCYDVRFPSWLRNYGNKYDLLVVPANWPTKRQYAWEHLLKARAIENQSYVIGANRSGDDKFGQYDGSTYIIDYMGQSVGDNKGEITTASLSKSSLEKFREHFPVWKDADEFNIIF